VTTMLKPPSMRLTSCARKFQTRCGAGLSFTGCQAVCIFLSEACMGSKGILCQGKQMHCQPLQQAAVISWCANPSTLQMWRHDRSCRTA
jgi:hypothetical protein